MPRPLICSLAALLFLSIAWPAPAAHPVIEKITGPGVLTVDGKTVPLTAPLVTPDMPAERQKAAFTKLVGAQRYKRYMMDSISAPFEISVDTLRKAADGDNVRGVDLYFIAHGNLDIIHEKDLLNKIMGDKPPQQDNEFETYAKPVDESKPEDQSLPPKGELREGVYKYRFPILEKVVVSGLVRNVSLLVDNALMQSIVSPRELLSDPDNPTQWRPIPRRAKTDAELGDPEPFQGFVCYVQATQLGFEDDVVLIEMHAAYLEPKGWFGGRNMLASKLPLVMQQAVRDFRRKLKEAQAESSNSAD